MLVSIPSSPPLTHPPSLLADIPVCPPLLLARPLQPHHVTSMKPSHRPTHAARPPQRRSQRTRQQITEHTRRDYEECPWCHRLFSTYRSSHTRHIEPCKAKHETRAREEAMSRAERVDTPIPDPYTPVLSDVEMDTEDASTGTQLLQYWSVFSTYSCFSYIHQGVSSWQRSPRSLLKLCPKHHCQRHPTT